ncbi:permease [Haloprofundus marisrubri]|uniref:Permease n=1 Tax=Haloprofundus marisrubri TaxID=1514971 RepID=A0A0W1R8E7_9EURY|nr:permease [Haloprofundus marisrubri]
MAFVGSRYLAWAVFGLFVYYVGRPISRRLERRLPSRSLAAATALLTIVIPVVALLSALLLVALGQLTALAANFPVDAVVSQLPFDIPTLPSDPASVYDATILFVQDPTVQSFLGGIGGVVGVVGATFYNLFLSLILAYFLLVEDRRIAAWFETTLFGEESLPNTYLRAVDAGLTSVFFGYTLTIFVVMLLTSLIYTGFNVVAPGGLNIPSAVLLGVITGVFTLVPLVGRSIVYFFVAAVLSLQAFSTDPTLLWYPVVFLAVMILLFDNVVRTYIRPYLSGGLLHTGLVMFAYLLGPPLFGWYGIFLGPLLMVFTVFFVWMVLPVLANPDREETDRPDAAAGPTLSEFERPRERTRPDDSATDTDRGDPQPG